MQFLFGTKGGEDGGYGDVDPSRNGREIKENPFGYAPPTIKRPMGPRSLASNQQGADLTASQYNHENPDDLSYGTLSQKQNKMAMYPPQPSTFRSRSHSRDMEHNARPVVPAKAWYTQPRILTYLVLTLVSLIALSLMTHLNSRFGASGNAGSVYFFIVTMAICVVLSLGLVSGWYLRTGGVGGLGWDNMWLVYVSEGEWEEHQQQKLRQKQQEGNEKDGGNWNDADAKMSSASSGSSFMSIWAPILDVAVHFLLFIFLISTISDFSRRAIQCPVRVNLNNGRFSSSASSANVLDMSVCVEISSAVVFAGFSGLVVLIGICVRLLEVWKWRVFRRSRGAMKFRR
jgi:hypothetical protein